jgi:hypothetical protein
MKSGAWSEEEFLERLHGVGAQAYHHLHPFHIRMNEGGLDRDAVRLWVANRFYYQRCIPMKDAAILSNCPFREVRRKWIKRIIDHDGTEGELLCSTAPIDTCRKRPWTRSDLNARFCGRSLMRCHARFERWFCAAF